MNNNMITIKLKNETRLVPKGSTLLSLLPDEQKKKFFVALVNGRVRELSFKISFDAEVEFLDLTHSEAGKAYEASLRYVIAMIFNELYPEESIRFSYNVSRSIFCQPLGNFHIERRIVDQVANRLREIVDADIPIERVTVSTEEAIQIYQKFNLHDKIDILKYRPEKDVHLYRCGNYFNYLHSYMVPSTGYLQNFILRPYSPGIIIQYPRYELNGQIPPFEEAPTYGRTLKRAYEWAKLIDTQTIYRINEKLTPENTVDFIQICETKHNNMLSEIGNLIKADIDNIRLIAIAGPSSSGKTTFSNRLRLQLMALGINPVMISIDDYYLDRDKIQPDENGEIDLEDIKTIDVELFNQHMYSLINGEEVELPRFDFMTAKRVPGRKIKVDPHSPIIIEGIHALNEQLSASIPKHQKFKIFISRKSKSALTTTHR